MSNSDGAAVTPIEVESPIINSPFYEPQLHWQIEKAKAPLKAEGRRKASYYFRVPDHAGRGRKQSRQPDLLPGADLGELEELALVNLLRQKVLAWREGELTGRPYDGASAVTRELLELWRSEDRMQRLFFAQIEAAETVIFLQEAALPYRKDLPKVPEDKPGPAAKARGFRAFTRYALKMATGTGKTTVMGMLAAWSILNRVAAPTDERFTDTLLIVCPNVTIRERLQELNPALGDLSLYRTRQLVPPHCMEELRRGEVMIANWHKLAKQETNSVGGTSARVVKTGEPVEVVINPGRKDERREIRYFESDAAWFKRIRRELGSGKGRSPHWLVFNDEAHHAYRRGDSTDEEENLDEDKALAKKNAREATIWIEGLDRINKLAGGRKNGIRLCVDVSATPFYIQGSGNEVGRPFPWIVSDFGLLDAIESGLVKIPQLPSKDISGAEEAAYFNIWRWVEAKSEQDGHGTRITPADCNELRQRAHQPAGQRLASAVCRMAGTRQAPTQTPGAGRVHCGVPRYGGGQRGVPMAGRGRRGLRRSAWLVPQPARAGTGGTNRLQGSARHRGRRQQGRDAATALYSEHRRQAGVARCQGTRGFVRAGAQAQRKGGQRG